MLPPLQSTRDFIERQASFSDPAERDRALADIEHELEMMLSAVGTYRGDAQRQMEFARQHSASDSGYLSE